MSAPPTEAAGEAATALPGLVDVHCHLYEFEDVAAQLDAATAVGVTRLLCCSEDEETCVQTLELAQRFPALISPCMGAHPWQV